MESLLERLRKLLRMEVCGLRDRVGTNLIGLRHIANRL